ncbi:MAG TPA: hypothetical protein VGG39_09265 [Polyangiaceae bacterium]|jgi:hypothetical protein
MLHAKWQGQLRVALPLLAPLVVVAFSGYAVADALRKLTYAILGRDQGIFQYVAWALAHGSRDYVDLHEINGPLGPLIHMAIMALGGADEHVFRTVDVVASSVVFLAVGASLPGLTATADCAPPRPVSRAAWALATWCALGAQYVVFGWWDTSQRESFYDLFLLASLAAQLQASRPWGGKRGRTWWWTAAGLASVLTWFGKPTCGLFTVLQVAVTWFDRRDPTPRRRRLAALSAGGAVAAALMLGFIAVDGSLPGFVRIVLLESPRLYTPIWAKSIAECYSAWNNAPKLNYALVTAAGVAVLALTRRLPVRFYVTATLLFGGLAVFFLQKKAFPYHLHPATAGTRLVWIAALVAAVEEMQDAKRRWLRVVPVGVAILVGWQCFEDASLSPYAKSDWDVAGATAAERSSEAFVRRFPWDDFFAWDLRRAATFLDATTGPADTVQLYGMDPYVLFLARRVSATPYVYSFELNVDASLTGGSGGHPDADARRWIRATAAAHAAEMQAALERRLPAAFVIVDHIPFTYPADSEIDLAEHCPVTYAWMVAHYRRAARFGGVRVWLRNDLHDRAAAAGSLPQP